MTTPQLSPHAEALRAELMPVFQAECRASVELLRMTPLAGGASMETWALDVVVDQQAESWVLRRDMGSNMSEQALSRRDEAAVIEAARLHGVSAPRVRFVAPHDAPRGWFVMERRPGESVGRRVVSLPELAHAREGLARSLGRELAAIHSVPAAAVEAHLRSEPLAPTEAATEGLRAVSQRIARHNPVWALAFRWLDAHRPPETGRRCLVHGDFRIGNLLVTPQGLSAVLDWEFAHLGDPHEDLAWITVRDWRFERDALEVGGVGSLDDFIAGYAEAGGEAVDRARVRWWAMLGNLRWSVMCHAQAERHLSGIDRSVEYASLGRKSAEIDWEILNLLRTEPSP
ncbi:MAG: phosphotransferase family protein [Myxococcales bacterium]|nr:phosphotransferase family protein [Myxococcales bacterium]